MPTPASPTRFITGAVTAGLMTALFVCLAYAQEPQASVPAAGDEDHRVIETIVSEPGGYFTIKGGRIVLDFTHYRGPRHPDSQLVTVQFVNGPQIPVHGVDAMDLVRYLLDDEKMFDGIREIHAVGPGSLKGPGTMLRRQAVGMLYIEIPDRFADGAGEKPLDESFVVDVQRNLLLEPYRISGTADFAGNEVSFLIHPGLREKMDADDMGALLEETVLYYRDQGIDIVAVSRFLEDGVMSRDTALAWTADDKYVLMVGIDWWADFRLLLKEMQASENMQGLMADPLGFNTLEEEHQNNWFTHVFEILKNRNQAPDDSLEAQKIMALRNKIRSWVDRARFPIVKVDDSLTNFLWRVNARMRQVTLLVDTVPLPAEFRPPKVDVSEVAAETADGTPASGTDQLTRLGEGVPERLLLRVLKGQLSAGTIEQAESFYDSGQSREFWILPLMFFIGLPCAAGIAVLVRRSYDT